MNFLDYYTKVTDKITGHLYTEEARALWQLAENWLPYGGRMAEVGCDMGRSTTIWAYWAREKNALLNVIDAFCWSTSRETFIDNMAEAGYLRTLGVASDDRREGEPQVRKGDFTLTVERSEIEGERCPDGFWDLLFIDADHSAEGIKLDCDIWPAKVRPGGVIVFHDYDNPMYDQMKPTIDKAMEGWELILRQEMVIAFRRPHE